MAVVWNHFGAASAMGARSSSVRGTPPFYRKRAERRGRGSVPDAVGVLAAEQADESAGSVHDDGEVVKHVPAQDAHVEGKRVEEGRVTPGNTARRAGIRGQVECRCDI